jgi:hypothetical protein
LAFDRQIAEKIVAERYPSEGPHYLEKTIQAGFELPAPSQNDLNDSILDQIAQICGPPSERDMVHLPDRRSTALVEPARAHQN